MYKTSDARNAEIIEVKLSIGQCKLLERLVDQKLHAVESGLSDFNEKPLKALLDVFWSATEETPAEKATNDPIRQKKARAWASGDFREVLKHG